MATTVRIHVFRGGCVELLPPMCMFCGAALPEAQFQFFTVQVGQGTTRKIALPVCGNDRLAAHSVTGDANLQADPGRNLSRYQQYIEAVFAIGDIHSAFMKALGEIRAQPEAQYDAALTKVKQLHTAILAGHPAADVAAEEERRKQKELDEVVDSAMFGIEGAATTGEVSVEVARSNRNKFLIVGCVVAVLTVLLVTCIAGGLIGYSLISHTPTPDEVAKKKPLDPPKQMNARIKEIDVGRNALKLLVGAGKYQTFTVTPQTEYLDAAGEPLPGGFAALQKHKDADVTILPTDDREGLRWLKLRK